MVTIFMNTENSKTNESSKFRYFTDKLNLKNPSKNITLVNLSICYTWKTLNLHIATANLKYLRSKFVLHDGSYSVSNIQDYF